MVEKRVRIGGASDAWRDSLCAIERRLGAGCHYFVMDHLAGVRCRCDQGDRAALIGT
jgi:hypothetical protein